MLAYKAIHIVILNLRLPFYFKRQNTRVTSKTQRSVLLRIVNKTYIKIEESPMMITYIIYFVGISTKYLH